jgi:RNA-directed DNA polymerase
MKESKSQSITKQMVWNAYRKVKANGGSAGVDGMSIEKFDEHLEDNLYKLWNRLNSGSYFPPPVKEVEIPKESGKPRKLGIPTVADRVAQMVVKEHLEPAIDPHFHPSSFGFRPGRSAHMALAQTQKNCWKMAWVIDLDIQNFFDEIDHDLLMKALKRHTREKWVLLYVERWLKASTVKSDGTVTERKKGTPQGGVISPLLANLYLHYAFDKWMEINFPVVLFERYADDIVVHCQTEAQAEQILRRIETRFNECKLRVHPEKTRAVYCKDRNRNLPFPNVSFDFLGYTFKPRKCQRQDTGKLFLGFTPAASRKAQKKMNDKVKKLKIHLMSGQTLEEVAQLLNPMLRGWINYFSKFRRSELYHFMFGLTKRLLKWVRKKHKRFRTSESKALAWLRSEAQRSPDLFAHWKAGFRITED